MSIVAVIVDDDERTRRVLSRVLQEQGPVAIHMFDDVSAAAAHVSGLTAAPELLIVCVDEPSSLEGTRTLREMPMLDGVPLIATAFRPTAPMVRQLAALGVKVVLQKPVPASLARERLWDALQRVRLSGATPGDALLARGGAVLVVDGSAEYRRFFRAQAASLFEVITAATGAEGLAVARANSPHAVFLGHGIGVLGPARFAHRARAESALDAIRLFLLVSPGDGAADDGGLFHGALPRTLAPDVLQQELARLVGP